MPVHAVRGAPDEGKAGADAEAIGTARTVATLPPGPLLSGRSEAADGVQPAPEENATTRGDKPGSSGLKSPPVERPQEREHPRERAERDLLEGGVESGEQDFYEPDL
jgi:hypothetical protein